MRPLKPIKQAQHFSGSIPTKLLPSEPILCKGKVPINVYTEADALAYDSKYTPLKQLASFGELKFMSESIYLVSNDGWKGHSLDVSMRLGYHMAYVSKKKTLYVNSIIDKVALGRKFSSLVGKRHKPNGLLQLATVVHGAAGEGINSLIEAIRESKYEVLILNSWEWGAITTKQKRKLFEAIDYLVELTRITIIIFTSAKAENITPGYYRHGKLGMLGDLADGVIDLRKENALLPTLYNDDLAIPSEEVKPIYRTSHKENKDEKKQTEAIEISNLEEVMGTNHVSNRQFVPA